MPRDSCTDNAPEWIKCPETIESLRLVDKAIVEAITCEEAFADTVFSHLSCAPGKRMRPALVLLAAKCGDCNHEELIRIATAVELLHVATLYHDDILDASVLRRGRQSVNSKWGNQVAVFAGTYIFSQAVDLFASSTDQVNSIASQTIANVWKGQMIELEGACNPDIQEDEVLEIIRRKTAALFELPCHLGGLVSGASMSTVKALSDYGLNLGMAFQLVDDIVDSATVDATGVGGCGVDIREGIYTLPILHALRTCPRAATLQSLLARDHLTYSDVCEAIDIVRHSDALVYVATMARRYVLQAQLSLTSLPTTPAKTSLLMLAADVMQRADLQA